MRARRCRRARAGAGAELRRGAIGIPLGDVLAFVITVWLAFVASAFIRVVQEEDVDPHPRASFEPASK